MQNNNKWYNYYIKNVNLDKIEWIKLNSVELGIFLKKNYLDKEIWEYVYDEKANSSYPTILGMNYLNFNSAVNGKKYNFLLGVTLNNIGKKTVVAATIYLDEYFIFSDQEKPVTYISTMEVNSFFRNKGIYKRMCEVLINFINNDQHIVITTPTEMGVKCRVFKILKNTLISNGFHNYICEDNYNTNDSQLHDVICFKSKAFKK